MRPNGSGCCQRRGYGMQSVSKDLDSRNDFGADDVLCILWECFFKKNLLI